MPLTPAKIATLAVAIVRSYTIPEAEKQISDLITEMLIQNDYIQPPVDNKYVAAGCEQIGFTTDERGKAILQTIDGGKP